MKDVKYIKINIKFLYQIEVKKYFQVFGLQFVGHEFLQLELPIQPKSFPISFPALKQFNVVGVNVKQ